MPKEPEYCREIMADILSFTAGRRWLTVSEVAKFEGRDRRTVQKCYDIDPKKGIDALVLAKKMCQYRHTKERWKMPKEPEYCREIMADILSFTGGRRRLTVSEVAKFEGRDRRTVQKCYGIDPKKGIDALVLAKKMCT